MRMEMEKDAEIAVEDGRARVAAARPLCWVDVPSREALVLEPSQILPSFHVEKRSSMAQSAATLPIWPRLYPDYLQTLLLVPVRRLDEHSLDSAVLGSIVSWFVAVSLVSGRVRQQQRHKVRFGKVKHVTRSGVGYIHHERHMIFIVVHWR